MPSSDVAILVAGSATAPVSYTVPNTQELRPLSANATFDGTLASGAFVPTLEILSDAGYVIARVPTLTSVAAGSSAEVTFAPFLRGAQAAATGSGSGFSGGAVGTITTIGAGTSVTNSQPSGATLSAFATKPTGVAKGDLLIVVLNSYQTASPFGNITVKTVPAGWTALYSYSLAAQNDGGNAGNLSARAAYWRVADGTEGTTLGPWILANSASGGTTGYLLCRAYRGISTGTLGAFAVNQTFLTGSSPWTANAPSVPTVVSGSVSLLAFTSPAMVSAATWATPTGYTAVVSLAGPSGSAATLMYEQLAVSTAPAVPVSVTYTSGSLAAHRFTELAQIVIYPAVT